jgi:hypothetical protein
MSHRIDKVLTTMNKKLGDEFEFIDPRLPEDFDMPKDANIAVAMTVEVPDNTEEAAGERFYGSPDKANSALEADWARVCLNAGRPLIRDTESTEFDFAGQAQQAADEYRPGRRGGFASRVREEEIEDINDIEELKEFLRKRGSLVGVSA